MEQASYENKEIKALYEEFYGHPLGELSEELLHTPYLDRSYELGNVADEEHELVG